MVEPPVDLGATHVAVITPAATVAATDCGALGVFGPVSPEPDVPTELVAVTV